MWPLPVPRDAVPGLSVAGQKAAALPPLAVPCRRYRRCSYTGVSPFTDWVSVVPSSDPP
jgi:hypothetical protein